MANAFDTFNAGVTHSLEGRFEEALAAFDQTLAVEPSHAGALSGRAMSLANLGRLADAAEAFRAALAIQPGFAENHFQLGHVELELGKFEAGVANIRKALELSGEPEYRQGVSVRLYNLAGHAMKLAAHARDSGQRDSYAVQCEFAERVFSLSSEISPTFTQAKEAVAFVQRLRAQI